MTKERWNKISEWLESGDPLKDINCDESELLDYIHDLRKQLNKLPDEP